MLTPFLLVTHGVSLVNLLVEPCIGIVGIQVVTPEEVEVPVWTTHIGVHEHGQPVMFLIPIIGPVDAGFIFPVFGLDTDGKEIVRHGLRGFRTEGRRAPLPELNSISNPLG